jgi:hypothetical protein
MLHMDEQEIMSMRYGSMLDMISCFSIYRGSAQQKPKKKKLTYDEIIRLK